MNAAVMKLVAEGAFEQTPLTHVLVYIVQHRLTGLLELRREEALPPNRLLLEAAASPQAKLLRPLSSPSELERFFRGQGTYRFYALATSQLGEEEVSVGLPTAALLAAAARFALPAAVVAKAVDPWEKRPARVTLSDFSHFNLRPEEHAVAEQMREGGYVLAHAQSKLGPDYVRRLFYVFVLLGAVEEDRRAHAPSDASAGAAASSSPATSVLVEEQTVRQVPEPPAGLASALVSHWQEIGRTMATIDRQNYFEMLGLSQEAKAQEAQKAYFGLVKRWHPDRLPHDLRPLNPQVELIFQRLTEAYHTLNDDADRERYLEALKKGGGTPEGDRQLKRIVNAAFEYQKAEVLLRRGDLRGAEGHVEAARALHDEEADYVALHGRILLLRHERIDEAEAMSDRALELDPEHAGAHVAKGQLLRQRGEVKDALKHFQAALKRDPKSVEAQREMRLARMRGSAPPARRDKPTQVPFFKRLFKK